MPIRLVNAHQVRQLLPMPECIRLMREAMPLAGAGGAVQPIRTALRLPDGRGLLGMMPGYLPARPAAVPSQLGIKVVTVYPGNFGTTLGSHQGMVLLFDAADGRPLAIIEAREVTAIRTAASSAVATGVLAPPGAAVLAIFGYGEQATEHVESMRCVRDIRELIVWGRNPAQAQAFAQQMGDRVGIPARAVTRVEEAVSVADILCTTTAAAEPYLKGEWLRPGQHLNVVGSSIPTTAEVDHEAVVRSRFYVDFKDSALALAGEFRRARDAGLVTEDHILGSVGDVLAGRAVGRLDPKDITLFKSLGMVSEDLVAARFVLDEAQRLDVGHVVDF